MTTTTRIVASLALAGVLAAGCTSRGNSKPPVPSVTTTTRGADDTSRLSDPGPSGDRARADWLKAHGGYPAWTLSADTLEQHFRALCRRITAAHDQPLATRARLARQYNADAQVASAAGFGPMEFRASGFLEWPVARVEAACANARGGR